VRARTVAGGAVAASYAALTSDARQEAVAPAPPSVTPVAQVPPPATTAPAPPAPPAPAPSAAATKAKPVTPKPVAAATPAPVTPSPAAAQENQASKEAAAKSKAEAKARDDAAEKAKARPKPLAAIALDKDDASTYDPDARATDPGEPGRAVDGGEQSAWTVTTPGQERTMGVGLALDLGRAQTVRAIELATSTPGFQVELYASERELPPDILDTRWVHVADREDVGETEQIKIGPARRAAFRHVLLWITKLPDDGPTVSLSNVEVFK